MSALVDQSSPVPAEPDPPSAPAEVVQDVGAGGPDSPRSLREDFGAHFEANYRRLVAQLYAITLDPAEAHDVVQDAYSRAWRSWSTVGSTPDPDAWVRRVAVRTTIRSWRRVLRRRPRPVAAGIDARTAALLGALGRLPAPERRCVVLHHMAGVSLPEIAAVESASVGTVTARLRRAEHVVSDGMADVLGEILGADVDQGEQP